MGFARAVTWVRARRPWLGAAAAAGLALAVSTTAPGAGLPVTDVAVAAALGAGIAAYPRVLVGTAAGIAVAAVVGWDRGGPAWERWLDAMPIVVWSTILGAVAYRPRSALEAVVGAAGALPAVAGAARAGVAGWWRRGRAARRHPLRWLRAAVRPRRRAGSGVSGPPLLRSPPALELRKERDSLLLVGTALLYAIARLATDRFHRRFSISADEAGVTTTSLVLSAALITFVLVACVVGGLWVARVMMRLDATRFALFTGLGLAVGLSGDGAPNWLDGAVGAVIGLVAFRLTSGHALGDRPVRWPAVVAVSAVVAVLVVAVAFDASDDSTARVRAGRSSMPTLGPFVIAPLHAPVLQVWRTGEADLPEGLTDGLCVSRLGNEGGTTLLHRAGVVWRVPSDRLILVADGCEGGDD